MPTEEQRHATELPQLMLDRLKSLLKTPKQLLYEEVAECLLASDSSYGKSPEQLVKDVAHLLRDEHGVDGLVDDRAEAVSIILWCCILHGDFMTRPQSEGPRGSYPLGGDNHHSDMKLDY